MSARPSTRLTKVMESPPEAAGRVAQAVWRALTENPHLTRWCSPAADMRARAGGSFRASVDRVTEFEARIDVFEPGRRLRLIYLPAAGLPRADSVMIDDFILDKVAGGTILR